jgi:hypothetical protein
MRITKVVEPYLPFRMVRDSNEQEGTGWKFAASRKSDPQLCSGTVIAPLETGDYTIEGLEHVLRVERKGSVEDLVSSMCDGRMKGQLSRLSKFKYAYVVIEARFDDLVNWHFSATAMRKAGFKVGLPTPDAAVSAFMKFHFAYPSVHMFFVGKGGRDFIRSLFKRVIEDYAKGQKKPQREG